MRKSSLEQLREAKAGTSKTIEVQGFDGMHELLLGGPPNPTQRRLLYAPNDLLAEGPDDHFAYVGMVGAAKTSAICSLGWMRLLFEPGFKLMVGRKDYNDLKDTTMKRMEEMLHRLPAGTLIDRDKAAPAKWWIRPIGNTDAVSEVTFMGLHERPSSYEFDGAIVDEADELDKDVMDEVDSRCRLKGKNNFVCIAFNPTDEDHWIYEDCTGLNAKGEKILNPDGSVRGALYRLFHPVRGENDHNLKPGYYEGLKRRMSPDMVERLILGKWGSSIKGTPVFGSVFKREWHAKDLLSYNPHAPLYCFHDFGYRHPVTLWAQPTFYGGLDILHELTDENVEIHDWAPRVLAETRTRFPDADHKALVHWGDPAARQHKDTGSTLAVLNAHGIKLHFRIGAAKLFDDGIRAVRMLLSRSLKGQPACRIDKRCTILIRAIEKGYRYPSEKEKGHQRPNTPLKDGYFDNFIDPLRYGVYGIFGPMGGHGVEGQELPDENDPHAHPVSPLTTSLSYGNLPLSIAYTNATDPLKNGRPR